MRAYRYVSVYYCIQLVLITVIGMIYVQENLLAKSRVSC
jgi:hypothetical protein